MTETVKLSAINALNEIEPLLDINFIKQNSTEQTATSLRRFVESQISFMKDVDCDFAYLLDGIASGITISSGVVECYRGQLLNLTKERRYFEFFSNAFNASAEHLYDMAKKADKELRDRI